MTDATMSLIRFIRKAKGTALMSMTLVLFACRPGEEAKFSATGNDWDSGSAMAAAVAQANTGLDFPSNGGSENDVRFRFTGAHLQPMYPATYIWRINLRRQAGYYTTFYWGPGSQFTGASYYGAHPYPDGEPKPASTNHKWSLPIDGGDYTTANNGQSTQLGYDAWKIQALRVYEDGGRKVHEFYYDLPDTSKVIRVFKSRSYGNNAPPSPALTFGTAPWDPGSKHLSGILRGLQLYSAALSPANLIAEINAPLSSSQAGAIWYLNLNPTPSDISDKSGKGHQPAWVTSLRPALWTDSANPPEPAPTVNLSANPSSIANGSASTLTWSSTNATACNATGAWSGSKALSGSQSTGNLTATSTYTLTCTGPGGSANQSATVTVTATPPPAPTVTLTANPASIASGSASTLTWSSTNATACNATGAWSGSKALSGSQSTGNLTATSTFTLTCTGAGGSANQSATVTVTEPPPGGGTTGLNFPSNGGATNDVRFKFTGGNLQPMYPATYIWRVNLRRQSGYYTTFFWGPDGAFTGTGYYGAHPYPDGEPKPSSTNHKWELSIDGGDFVTDLNGHSTQLGYDTWKTQSLRVYDDGTRKVHEFYWDLPDLSKVIRVYTYRSYGPPSNPALTFGTAPWAPGSEHLSGILRGMQLYSSALAPQDIVNEVNNPLGTSQGASSIWYLNLNPTPSDIADKSGKGHNPVWVTSLRPGLWTP